MGRPATVTFKPLEVGTRFGRLVISGPPIGKPPKYPCICDCGKTSTPNHYNLISGSSASCGCITALKASMRRTHQLAGQRFGRLVAKEKVGVNDGGNAVWRCECDCGGERRVTATCLSKGETQSCGCIKKERMRSRNGKGGVGAMSEYQILRAAISRCHNPNNSGFDGYGGRGISVHQEWRDDFWAFYHYVGPRPSADYSLDRINVNGNYEPGNVRWATREQQARNKRNSKGQYIHVGDLPPSSQQAVRELVESLRQKERAA
jgi:hypothetical protein